MSWGRLEMFILLFTHPMYKAINTRIISKGHRLRSHKLYFSKCFGDLDNTIDSSCTIPLSSSYLHSQFTAFYQIKENTLFLRLAAVQRTWLEDSYCKNPTNKLNWCEYCVSINRDIRGCDIYKHKERSSSKEHWVNFSTLDRDATNQSALARWRIPLSAYGNSDPCMAPCFSLFVFWRPYTGAFNAAQVHINDV